MPSSLRPAAIASHADAGWTQMLLGEERPTDAGLHTHQQTISGLPDASRVPVAKHPRFGRYFWVLFEAVVGRDLITSFDRPRAESSPALTLVAASTTAIIPKNPTYGFMFIVNLLRLRPHAITPTRTGHPKKSKPGVNPNLAAR
jgi:hypothetical protein